MTFRHMVSILLGVWLATGAAASGTSGGLVADPDSVIDLAAGFSYRIVARAGDTMSDGLRVPALPDGMGTFPGPDGTTIVVCNHEGIMPELGPFGPDFAGLDLIDTTKLYDRGDGTPPPSGSTTTFVWDTRERKLVRQFLSMAGMANNCVGGVMPWGTWLTCEETTLRAGQTEGPGLLLAKDHGYVFEVPARADGGLEKAVPLPALGRFVHEGTAYDDRDGTIYETEDLQDGLFYRFIPQRRGDLSRGRLQALGLESGARETSNHVDGEPAIAAGQPLKVKWIDVDQVESPGDDLRVRGYERGACRFDRLEGVCMLDGAVYFTATTGGALEAGQIWRYTPAAFGGNDRAPDGVLELFYEVADTTQMLNPDNIMPTPGGNLLVCEDPRVQAHARFLLVTKSGDVRTLGRGVLEGELTGPAFSPDGTTLFINMQKVGLTLAITGPWSDQ